MAQGTEAGGHGARRGRSTLPFVPVVVDLAAPMPVLAAGGIADGRGVAAALALGAAGALIGTRFQATAESLADPAIKKAIVRRPRRGHRAEHASWTSPAAPAGRASTRAAPSATRSSTSGAAGKPSWPPTPAPGRRTATAWPAASCPRCRSGPASALDLITDLPPAAELVAALAAQAEDVLARAGRY